MSTPLISLQGVAYCHKAALNLRVHRDNSWQMVEEGLADINFAIHAGDIIGVHGGNGVEKTTLLRLVSGNLLPQKGQVHISCNPLFIDNFPSFFMPKASGLMNIKLAENLIQGMGVDNFRIDIAQFAQSTTLGDCLKELWSDYSPPMKKLFIRELFHAIKYPHMILGNIFNSFDKENIEIYFKEWKKRYKKGFIFTLINQKYIMEQCNCIINIKNSKIDNIEYKNK